MSQANDIAEAVELLEATDAPPPPKGEAKPAPPWYPDLNPIQEKIFNDPALNILGHGEKGSGKSIAFGHKLVRHAFENDNALVLVISPSMRTGNEGIWYDLETLILPQWKDGIGLEFTQSKLDPNTKDRHRWIRNRFGGWSKLLLMSIPYPAQVQARCKGPAPSMVYIDELTECESREYYSYTSAQLGRRRGIAGPQQFCASCNPKGPSHWVYKLFFEECVDEETGKRDRDYSVYHVPVKENLRRLPAGYVERLEKIFKNDPTEAQRLLEGVWVDRPTGDGLFKEYYIPTLHCRGDFIKGQGLLPVPGFPLILGYDLGQVFSSVTFEQCLPCKDKVQWIVFDEVDHLGEKILYKKLAWEIMSRLKYWREMPLLNKDGKVKPYHFEVMHITDESAINQWRPGGEGSYDAWEFEREYNRLSEKPVKMVGCPKGKGSVKARVRLCQAKLFNEELAVSALCRNTLETLLFLEASKEDPDVPKRSKFLHKFDSLTYPMFKLEVGGMRNYLRTEAVAPSLIRCGN